MVEVKVQGFVYEDLVFEREGVLRRGDVENLDMIYVFFVISYNFSQEVIIFQLLVDFVGFRIKLLEKKIFMDFQFLVKFILQKSDFLKLQLKMVVVFLFFVII